VIAFVSTNRGKFREVTARLAPSGIRLRRVNAPYPEIQADRLEDVVSYASHIVATRIRGEFLIDDSGLFIDALNGFPGVYSSYVYRTVGCDGVLRLMRRGGPRTARFESVVLLGRRGRASKLFRGACTGTIAPSVRGSGGFGFDPIFVPRSRARTFAEMSLAEKNAVSHRARAVDALATYLQRRGS